MPEKTVQKTNPKINHLAIRIWKLHRTFLKFGPRVGGSMMRLVAFYCLGKIFFNGGFESVSFVCYEHMVIQGEKENARKSRRNA